MQVAISVVFSLVARMAGWRKGSLMNKKNRKSSWKCKARSKQACDKSLDGSLWCLPNEILVYILKGLHIKDLLNLKVVSNSQMLQPGRSVNYALKC